MSTITVLKKTGVEIKIKVKEAVPVIWNIMNTGRKDDNFDERCENRDYIYLTDLKGEKIIINKRYIFMIEE